MVEKVATFSGLDTQAIDFDDLKISRRRLTQGRTNTTVVVTSPKGQEFVWKTDRKFGVQSQRVEKELERIGFLELGGAFGIRSYSAEQDFAEHLNNFQLKAQSPVASFDNGILYPYLLGSDFRHLLNQGINIPILSVLHSLTTAHSYGITYGDRWPQNIVLNPDRSFTHIDFDLEIDGPVAKELEMAQILYGTIRDAANKREIVSALYYWLLSSRPQGYDWKLVKNFITAYAEGYQDPSRLKVLKLEHSVKTLVSVI